ncbi:MAG TPA: type IV pili methyl-accepting chemotaxis transducer N-terminal domain-containing protein, partial [Pseudoxanthomonas sp.]|nr:type IV pili methyl-accepting chemotaxis transducer N-terminal domain-containing protein [Pseudoxanthomonas sp.]
MSTAPETPKTSRLGGVSTGFWLVLLALSVLVFGLNTGVATWQGSRLAGASTAAADLQVLSQQLANQGRDAVTGNAAAFKEFRATRAQIATEVSGLQSRFGSEPGVSGPLAQLVQTWTPLAKNAEQIVASEQAVLALSGNADRFVGRVPQLQAQLNEVV